MSIQAQSRAVQTANPDGGLPATFVLSLDCEGKWGMADKLTPRHHELITDARLSEAYEHLLGALERYEIPATFALVGTLNCDTEEFEGVLGKLADSPGHQAWLEQLLPALHQHREGWFLPRLHQRVLGGGRHEIGSHSLCHLPFNAPGVDEATLELDYRIMNELAKSWGISLRTLVYPRNIVVRPDLAEAAGIAGVRDAAADYQAGVTRRLRRLGAEFGVVGENVEAHASASRPVMIPPGKFLNWRVGARRSVPLALTVRRWVDLLDQTIASGGVLHMFLHPHNLITGSRQQELLESVLREVSERVRRGLLTAMTQAEYCGHIQGSPLT